MNLMAWLEKIKNLHVSNMDLSLERVCEVADRLNLRQVAATVITVGGTNGKGSCVAGLETIYLKAGYRVGAFTSPILLRHNEYIRVQGVEVEDQLFCEAFAAIDTARGEITLTPFEFNALVAFFIFQQANLDVWLLEVGLGGRFDAVNVIDADVAIVASIGIDHVEWLGDTREKIGFEKAGIFRADRVAICGDFDPPISLVEHAHKVGACLYLQNKSFGFEKNNSVWSWWCETKKFENLPLPQLALQNMACVLMTIEVLQQKLPVSDSIFYVVLNGLALRGRIQVIPGEIMQVMDVAHNPASAEFLARWLREQSIAGNIRAVFSMLGDKDIAGTLNIMEDYVDSWHIASLPVLRGATLEELESSFRKIGIDSYSAYSNIQAAHADAMKLSRPNDCVVTFGSFHTVAEVLLC